MAPRRRVSRRVVKSTFQECFEYDIPGFRGVESKRSSVILPRNRLNSSGHKIKRKIEDIKKVATRNGSHPAQETNSIDKEKSRKEVPKTKEFKTIKKIQSGNKVQSPLANRSKAKLFMGTDYKGFKSSLSKNKANPDDLKKIKVPVSNISSTTPDLIFGSKNWQPVVHLEKICVTASGHPKSCTENNKTPVKQDQKLKTSTSSRSLDLVTRLKNVLRDPMAEKELRLSNKVSNSMLVDHILKETSVENSNCDSPKKVLERKCIDSFGDLNPGRSMNINHEHLLPGSLDTKQPGSDSAIEDWPDSASGESDDEENKTYAPSLFSPSEISDWSSPQVTLIVQWQKHFNSVAEELMSSFDSLKNIIEEKNSMISALSNKLNNYDENPCHKILDNILLDYDKHNPQNPATKIINSILQYPNLKP